MAQDVSSELLSQKQPKDCGEFLPEMTETSSSLSERSLTSANDEVRAIIGASLPKSKRKKTEQHFYGEEVHASNWQVY